ncbi:uncharacterized protein FA14DRAFT_65461 [Meira miltonrushii]|uniref:GYF domain-containing protein n=1 Tax=Meira miltonrushii TaxID=1280837 RepID=A0A316V980_9BASI|nr:uncharacterized protein FA14DRAFT_65461 [Meira miltonrushii]PWN33804.1 hypothetical protein FA14DRAFT_65461 [Meira miltonrushii]
MTSNAKRKTFGPPASVNGGILSSELAGQQGGAPSTSKRTRFDVPSSTAEEDTAGDLDIEEQDRKRLQQGRKGRVVTDGYDSEDSSGDEGSDAEELDQVKDDDKEEEDEDMFNLDQAPGSGDEDAKSKGNKKKYLELNDIEGQEFSDDESGKDKEEGDAEFELEDDEEEGEGQDAEAGDENLHDPEAVVRPLKKSGKKGKGPESKEMGFQIEKFNMKNEMATGRFDEEGNYIENAKDPHAEHDKWLSGNYNRKNIKAAKEAQERRMQEAKMKEERREFADLDEDECKMYLVGYMLKGESVLEALQRLGAQQKKKSKAGKKTKAKEAEMVVDNSEDLERVKADLNKITALASELMSRFGLVNVYEATYESLLRDVQRSGLVRSTWDPAAEKSNGAGKDASGTIAYVYKWSPAYLKAMSEQSGQETDPETAKQTFGPFNVTDLLSWKKGGYFGDDGERIQLQPEGQNDSEWSSWQDVFG